MDDIAKLAERVEAGESPDAFEYAVAAMIAQSTSYPIVPPGYQGRVEPMHPFAARWCLLAALRALADGRG